MGLNKRICITKRIVAVVLFAAPLFCYCISGYMYERSVSESGNPQWQVAHQKLANLLPDGHDPKVYTSSSPDVSNWVIVTLKDGLDKKVVDKHVDWLTTNIESTRSPGGSKNKGPADVGLHCLYQSGYAGKFSDKMVSDLEKKKEVLFVRKDRYISVDKGSFQDTNTRNAEKSGDNIINALENNNTDNQVSSYIMKTGLSRGYGPSWGLDRINQHLLPLDGFFSILPPRGAGVDIYVLDAGVRLSHSEFGGRARLGATFVSGSSDDSYGHGTHVSGIIAGRSVGVANQANIISVKVIYDDGKGPISSVIMGIDWVIRNVKVTRRPSIINMSIGTNRNDALDHAVLSAVRQGVLVVVSAGNDKMDSCNSSPSGLESSFTVGATDPDDSRASYSNFGSCVKIYAPGSYIKSASNKGDYAYKMLNGTSMAAPFVTGTAAVHLSRFPRSGPLEIMRRVVGTSTQRLIKDDAYQGGLAPMLFVADGASQFRISPSSTPLSVASTGDLYSPDDEGLDKRIQDDYKKIISRPRKAMSSLTASFNSIPVILALSFIAIIPSLFITS